MTEPHSSSSLILGGRWFSAGRMFTTIWTSMPVTNVRRLFEANAAIAASFRTWLVKVDENLRVSEWTNTTIAGRLPPMHEPHRLVGDHLHRAERLRLEVQRRLFESCLRIRILACALRRRPCLRVVRRLRGRRRRRVRWGGWVSCL